MADTSTSSIDATARTPYQALGDAQGVRALVDRFYDLMDLEPEYAALRALHPSTLDGSRDKLFWFLSGWLGGPNLYVERFGHPRLRARHLPYAIDTEARDAWMSCMRRALAECDVAPALRTKLDEALAGTADWMRNTADRT